MTENKTLLAIFEEVDPASEAIAELRRMGIGDDQTMVISGIPFGNCVLGRPPVRTSVPRFALAGAALGIGLAVFLIWGIPLLDPLHVGGQPLYPLPPLFIVGFELAMLGMMCAAFLGVFIDSHFPSGEPKEYVPEVSDGKIAILFNCPAGMQKQLENAMTIMGAEQVRSAEVRTL
jgi:hypothetical protein